MKLEIGPELIKMLGILEQLQATLDDMVVINKLTEDEQKEWDIYCKSILNYVETKITEGCKEMFDDKEYKNLIKFLHTPVGVKYLNFMDKTYFLLGKVVDAVIENMAPEEDDAPDAEEMN